MKTLNILFLLFLIITFMVGMYMHTFGLFDPNKKIEPMDTTVDTTNDKDNDCPDILINKGNVLLLYNSKKPNADGINPITFSNLDEYINYLEIQRNNGIRCPVLYAQQENDTQGNDVYRIRPSPFDQQGGLPTPTIVNEIVPQPSAINIIDANRDNPPYNMGGYQSFDPMGLHVGQYTDIDKIHDSTELNTVSDNPADPNWGGVLYTESAVQSGKYDDNKVGRPLLVTTKNVMNYPNLYGESSRGNTQ